MLSFIVTGDLHLDHPFASLRRADERLRHLLVESTFTAWNHIVAHCLRESVDFLLVTGDVYDFSHRSLRAQLAFRKGLLELSESGIRSYIIHGNHDPLSGWSSTLAWPEEACFFPAGSPAARVHHQDGVPLAVLHGISYPQAAVRENLALQFSAWTESPLYQIGLLHCNAGGQKEHEPYAPCSLDDLRRAGLHFWALGHVHAAALLSRHDPVVVYPGSPQGLHRNERGDHSCTLVRVDGNHRATLLPLSTARVRWESLSVDLSGTETLDEGLLRVEEALGVLPSGEDRVDTLLSLTFTGSTHLHTLLRRPSDRDAVETALGELLAVTSLRLHLDRMTVNTCPPLDLRTLREGQDFLGDCLRMIQGYREDPPSLSPLVAGLSLFQTRSGRKPFPLPAAEEFTALLDEAELLILETLLEGPA